MIKTDAIELVQQKRIEERIRKEQRHEKKLHTLEGIGAAVICIGIVATTVQCTDPDLWYMPMLVGETAALVGIGLVKLIRMFEA